MQGHRRRAGAGVHSEEKGGYIRVHSGTFGYIRVHSGVCAHFPDLAGAHENQRFLGYALFTLGTFAACTHPFCYAERGESCEQLGSAEELGRRESGSAVEYVNPTICCAKETTAFRTSPASVSINAYK